MIRAFHPNDLEEVKRIHSIYYADKSTLPDFLDFVCAFIIENEQGIVTAGGLRDIAELVIVTDQSRIPKDRMNALYQMLDASTFVGQRMGYDQIYAFTQDPKWNKRMQKSFGFRPPQGQALILDL